MAGVETMAKELARLNKQDLIDIILKKNVPNELKVSDNLRKFINQSENNVFVNSASESSEQSADASKVGLEQLINIQCELKCVKIELECFKKLNVELSKSIADKDFIIKLLNYENSDSKPRDFKNNVASTSTSEENPRVSGNAHLKMKENKKKPEITTEQVKNGIQLVQENILKKYVKKPSSEDNSECKGNNDTENNDWQTVLYKRKTKVITGTNTASNMDTLKGVPKTAVLHVYRLNPETSEETLRNFIIPHFPEVTCKKLKSRFSEKYASFQVSIFEKNFRKAMDPSLWPQDACIQRFFFKPKKNPINQ